MQSRRFARCRRVLKRCSGSKQPQNERSICRSVPTSPTRSAHGGVPIKLRDRVELELIELPERVRVRLVAENMRYTPSHIVVDDDNAGNLQAAALGARLVRVHGDVIEFVPLQVTKDFPSPVVERRHLDAMLKIDTRLRDCIAAGEMVVEQRSDQENKLVDQSAAASPTQPTWKDRLLALTGLDLETCPRCGGQMISHALDKRQGHSSGVSAPPSCSEVA